MTVDWEKTRITILVDNNVKPGLGLMPEHGFAALIERGALRVLFDSGQGPALDHNARVLGKDLYPLNFAVLSHGHYDHTGGLLHVAESNRPLTIIAHPDVWSSHMAKDDSDPLPHYIGMPHTKEKLDKTGAHVACTWEWSELARDLWFTGFVPRVFASGTDSRLCRPEKDRLIPDPMEDDASLVIETKSGTVVLLGCAHAGLGNIVQHVRNMLHITEIYAIIGGTHLAMSDPAGTLEAVRILEAVGVKLIAPAHCTEAKANETLRTHFGSRWVETCAGSVFEF